MNFLVQIINGCKTIVEATASLISFDNSGTSLVSTDVQGALIEIANSSGVGTNNVDGGFANSTYLISQNVDGGFANSTYLISQNLDGGGA